MRIRFQEIRQLADRAGVEAIIAASRSRQLKTASDEDLVQRLGGMESDLDRAFWTFLYRPQYFEFASLLAGTDRISSASWAKHPDLPRVTSRVDGKALKAFGRLLAITFTRWKVADVVAT